MRIFCQIMALCCFVLVASSPAQANATYTLEEAVLKALQVNPSIEAKQLLLEQAQMNVGVAQSYFWPHVSLVASASRVDNLNTVETYSSDDLTSKTRSQGLRVTLSLFAGFAHLSNLQKSLINVEVEKAQHDHARLELGCNVQLQFLQLLKLREDLKSAEAALERIQTQLKASEAFVRVGMAPYLNVLQNEVELSQAQQRMIRVRNDMRTTAIQLNRYLGLLPDETVNYTGSLSDLHGLITYSEEQAIDAALHARPDLRIAHKSVEAAFKDMHSAMSGFLPRVDANYDHFRTSKDYEDSRYKDYTRKYWAAGLNFSWELFGGGSTAFSSLAERKRAQALGKSYEDAMSNARTEVIRALLDIETAQELIKTTRAGENAARESYEMANKRYLTNTGTITDLLDAQAKLVQAENDTSQALMESHAARSKFYFYIGVENPGLE